MKSCKLKMRSCAAGRGGFTLVELLVVVAVIGVLATMLSGAIIRSVNNAKFQRSVAEQAAIKGAIVNYWHDYGRWPLPPGSDYGSGTKFERKYKKDNYKVIRKLLYSNSSDNPDKKAYLDESNLKVRGGVIDDSRGAYNVGGSLSQKSGGGSLDVPVVGYVNTYKCRDCNEIIYRLRPTSGNKCPKCGRYNVKREKFGPYKAFPIVIDLKTDTVEVNLDL